jgi:hypothetical protein
MNKILYILIVIFFSHHSKAEPSAVTFGSGGWNSDSPVSCSDVNITELSDGSVGFCYGQSSEYVETIKKIELSRGVPGPNGTYPTSNYLTPHDQVTCSIFEGNLVIDSGQAGQGVILQSTDADFSGCKDGVIYDLIIVYMADRIYSGYTNYPDGSNKVAKTTNYCGAADVSLNIADLSWIDSITALAYNGAQCAVRQSSSWNTFALKAASTPTTSDFTNDDAELTVYPESASGFLNSLSDFSDASTAQIDGRGCYREQGSRSYSTCSNGGGVSGATNIQKIHGSNSEISNIFNGEPFQKYSKKKMRIKVHAKTYNAAEYGVRFYFQRNGSVAEFLGTNPAGSGLYLELIQSEVPVEF